MNIRLIITTLFCMVFFGAPGQNVGISETSITPDASAILELKSVQRGFLTPRMTETQKNGISLPASGLLIYQTDGTESGFYYNEGTPASPHWVLLGRDNLGNHIAEQNLDMSGYQINNVGNPSNSGDAVNVYSLQSGMLIYGEDNGTTDDYSITLTPSISSYNNGMLIHFKANTANTGSATLNVNGLGARSIKKAVISDLGDNDILSGQIVAVIYDGVNFQMLSQTGNTSSVGGGTGGCFTNYIKYDTPGTTSGTIPSGVTVIKVEVWGAGGGGSKNYVDDDGAGGGGGGAYAQFFLDVTAGNSYSVTVGAGGAGAPAPGPANGTAGGNSEFSYTDGVTRTVTCGGGGAGTLIQGGAGGTVSTINVTEYISIDGGSGISGNGTANARESFGGSGGDGGNGGAGGTGGGCWYSGYSPVSTPGCVPGGGGGATACNTNPGDGSPGAHGRIIVWW